MEIVTSARCLPFGELMDVYAESNAAAAREQWPDLDPMEGLCRAEMEFYQYLRQDFFTQGDSFYALWREKGKLVCALRLEHWREGWLLEGLETHPEYRGRGCAEKLLGAALSGLEGPVYSHVNKDNAPSLAVHRKCGFVRCRDTALVNGSFDHRFVTMKKG